MKPFPIPSDLHPIPIIKNIPSSPCIIKPLEETFDRVNANVNELDNHVPCHVTIDDKVLPNLLSHLRFMLLFMVEHPILVLNPNLPKRNTTEKMSNHDLLGELLANPFPEECLFPIETIVIVRVNNAKFVHDEHSPP